jgi:hypothetical protein
MGKRAQEKKLAKQAALVAEKQRIEQRKAERIQPQLRYAKHVSLALAATIFLLWMGAVVLDKISLWVSKS